ncbi:DUF4190 domain-containing protein [Chitinilyticum piscinae]|uniref:DUF4190 domain-containing protein n=1 Tax=Chitinilyticum piscinae TaxID=2866724 RepID=A0A8J7KD46_9NEIS|nr:DUF4190 domain-containing protein [Chitinilyticum piscinae]MBE9608424.1 DUF4190 domain-containing protein [Chitinilyticum piscinae]
MTYCPRCGAANAPEALFCASCGSKLHDVAAEANPYAVSHATQHVRSGQLQGARNSTLAIISLVAGILQLFCCCLGSIVAVVCGHLARSEIRKGDGQVLGDGMAMAGLILGYIGLVCSLLYFALILVGVMVAPLAS